jgi:hypothetical protein
MGVVVRRWPTGDINLILAKRRITIAAYQADSGVASPCSRPYVITKMVRPWSSSDRCRHRLSSQLVMPHNVMEMRSIQRSDSIPSLAHRSVYLQNVQVRGFLVDEVLQKCCDRSRRGRLGQSGTRDTTFRRRNAARFPIRSGKGEIPSVRYWGR